jgi:hypothetical protein
MNARKVTWKMCGSLAFHFHETAKDVDNWTDDEWAEWKRMRACFWGQSKDGLLYFEDAEKLFDQPEGTLPKKYADLVANWIPENGTSKSKSKRSNSRFVTTDKDPEGFKILKIVRD